LAQHLDRVCNDFEAAWRAGQRPRIEQNLLDIAERERSPLFTELLKIDLAYRRLAGEQPAPEEYQALFPDLAPLTAAVFAQGAGPDAPAALPEDEAETAPPGPPAPWGVDSAGNPAGPVEEMRDTPGPATPAPVQGPGGAGGPDAGGEADPAPESAAAEAVSVPGYTVLGELGHGGMGVVYRAVQQSLNRHVALKMIRDPDYAGDQGRARFSVEAKAVARLEHPHVVRIYDFGEHNGLPYFAMECVEGGSLAQRAGGEAQPPSAAAELVETLALAMDYIHRQDIVHRDLKPGNILLQQKSEARNPKSEKDAGAASDLGFRISDFEPKVTDFGLAKRLDEKPGLTLTKTVLGTASYMAPEQAEGRTKDISPATDVYALGAILYELLTGQPPFKAATRELTILQVLGDEPVLPTQLRPDVPRDLEAICLKCLEKEPGRRYASGAALAQDLRCFLNGEPISIESLVEWEWRERWARRTGYELLDVLTWGVRDVVYKAREMGLGRLVALKVLTALAPGEPGQMARFRREAEVLAQLRHANIVQIYNFGEHNGRAYFSMEFMDGGSLIEKFVDSPVPPARAAELTAALADALEHAHQRNILHCALKPSNVLLTSDGVPKIANFGLAILLEKEQEETAQIAAYQRLPSYMAPELAAGRIREVGPATDVYALGAVLYKLLTGQPPFLGETVQDTREQVCSREPVPPSRWQPGVPRELEKICLACLQKEPRQRPAGAAAVARDLRRFLSRKETATDEFDLVPGYELLEELGRGGLGIVHKARHVGLDQIMALKVFNRLAPDWLNRIRAACRALARLKHPNLLQVYDCGARDGLLYVAEELVEGRNLEQQVAGTMQPPRAAARLVETLARAMAHAHAAGIVHRNLKPRVVLLAADGQPKISSFELAKLLGHEPQEAEREGTLVGTPNYMAPEQSMGRADSIWPATDVYALGAILYQLLAGGPPFTGASLAEILEHLRSQPPVPPSRSQPAVPSDLDAICLKCLEKEPARRYAGALELAEDLKRFLAGKPVRARPTGLGERLLKWLQRGWGKGG
jgi:serine/threonine protein kinase